MGTSVAYHLSALGIGEVLLLERDELTSGTTWHAAGLVAQLRETPNLTRLAAQTRALYRDLDAQGEPTGYREPGALTLASHPDRVIELKRQASFAARHGVAAEWLTQAQVRERWPAINVHDLRGALHIPGDGYVSPVDATQTLARLARGHGATIREHCAVTRLVRHEHAVVGVEAEGLGLVRARYVVLCAGLWSRALAATVNVDVPLYPTEHSYAVTEPSALTELPILRDPDAGVYLKPEAGRWLIGCFETRGKAINPDRVMGPYAEFPFDLDHFAPYLARGLNRLPDITNTGIRAWLNGPEAFTADGRYLLGEVPGLEGLYVAAGFNSIGIQSAGGVGAVLAQWIRDGRAPMDLWEVDVRRMHRRQNDAQFLKARVEETLGLLYAMHWPYRQPQSARTLRRSPCYHQTAELGACFGELGAWERPNWYLPNQPHPQERYSYGRPEWFEPVQQEHLATRTALALYDQTSFAKYHIEGPDAVRFLNRLCSANVDTKPGQLSYCQWLNEAGGIEADVTVARLNAHAYWVISAAASETRDLAWLARWQRRWNANVVIRNITERYGVLGLMGPESRRCLQALSANGFEAEQFPFASWQDVTIADVPVRAFRLSYVGVLGWELYVPWDQTATLYEVLSNAGAVPAGYHAMNALRLEKAFRHWGHDLTDEDNPFEAGLAFTLDWRKAGGFLGREALATVRRTGVRKRLLLFVAEDPDVELFHHETLLRNGRPAGYLRSAAYGFGVGAALGFGYVETEQPERINTLIQDRYEVDLGGRLVAVRAHRRALYDPDGAILRG